MQLNISRESRKDPGLFEELLNAMVLHSKQDPELAEYCTFVYYRAVEWRCSFAEAAERIMGRSEAEWRAKEWLKNRK